MYHVINSHIDLVLQQITTEHVTEYDYLFGNRHRVEDRDYQRRFRVFWALNAARLSETFCTNYFALLEDVLANQSRDIREVARLLYLVESNSKGHKLQFSFASKLLHMADPQTPIYDAMIADFFFFEETFRTEQIPERIEALAAFHQFLAREYDRILRNCLLSESIENFKHQLKPKYFTDEKIIDSLIWGFVSLQRKGATGRGEVIYC